MVRKQSVTSRTIDLTRGSGTTVVRDKSPLTLPHERDQIVDKQNKRRPLIQQAEKDLADGKVDTDNYTRMTAIVAASRQGRRRR